MRIRCRQLACVIALILLAAAPAFAQPEIAVSAATGAAAAPIVALSPAALTFASQATASTSAAQTVTLTNTGSAALAITSVAASGDFAETNTCGTSIDAGKSCTISVTFAPTATGDRTGTLTVTDSASDSPQTAALTGTGADLIIAPGNGSSASATVSAGQPATYSLAFTPVSGLSGSFAIACQGAPTAATCTPNPASINLTSAAAQEVTVTVTTTARSSTAPAVPAPRGWPPAVPAGLLAMVTLLAVRCRPRLRRLGLAGAGFALAAMFAACGGGAAPAVQTPPPSTTPVGTPSGTYTLTVSATQGAIARTQQLTLVVN